MGRTAELYTQFRIEGVLIGRLTHHMRAYIAYYVSDGGTTPVI